MDRKRGNLPTNIEKATESLVWVKVVGIGNASVGKTCLIKHFCESKFSPVYQPTVGVDYGFKIQTVHKKELRVHLWDLSGNPDYLDVRNELYSATDAVFLTFDVSNEPSFQSLDQWVKEFDKFGTPEAEIVVVGNKVDLKAKRVVSQVEAKKWASNHKFGYHETSSATGEGVEKMFEELLNAVIKKKKIRVT